MKKLWISILLISLSFAGQTAENIDKSLDVNARSYIKIEHVNGEMQITSWDKEQVRVTGTLGDRTEKFIFERNGNDVLIKVKVKNNQGWGNWGSDKGDDLKVWIPASSRLNYSAVNADVEVSNVSGGSEIETVNGRIQVKNLSGRVKLDSVNGNINASKLHGDVKIETVNGDIESQSASGKEDQYGSVNGSIRVISESEELSVETVNGDVELTLGQIKQLNLETVNGALEASMTLLTRGEVNASTVDGTVKLSFQKDVSARFDIQAHAGGSINNKISANKVEKAKYGPSRWLEFSLNEGKANVNVSTVSGTVTIANN